MMTSVNALFCTPLPVRTRYLCLGVEKRENESNTTTMLRYITYVFFHVL